MNQIIPYLYIGDMVDGKEQAAKDNVQVLCVMWDNEPNVPDKCTQIATTTCLGDHDGTQADPAKMDQAADWIHEQLMAGERVLVHCAFGVERSPLTVVWYLMRYRQMNLGEAYAMVMSRRPQAQYRGGWLSEDIKLNGCLPERVTT